MLCCAALYCTVLYCAVLHCTVLCCAVHCTVLCCAVQCTAHHLTLLFQPPGSAFLWGRTASASASVISDATVEVFSSAALSSPLPRLHLLAYYSATCLYYWLLATPLVSFVFGSYLFLSVYYLGQHWNEAFSSLRIESFKVFSFLCVVLFVLCLCLCVCVGVCVCVSVCVCVYV